MTRLYYVAYSLERTWRVVPALCPGRVLLSRIALGQPPSLHRLRRRFHGFVRLLPRYYGAVRLVVLVHLGIAPLGLPSRPRHSYFPRQARRLPASVHGACVHARGLRPRAECTVLAITPGVLLPSAPVQARRLRRYIAISRLNNRPARTPVNASPPSSRKTAHDSENKMDRYSFLVGLFHPQHHTGFGRRFRAALKFLTFYSTMRFLSSVY